MNLRVKIYKIIIKNCKHLHSYFLVKNYNLQFTNDSRSLFDTLRNGVCYNSLILIEKFKTYFKTKCKITKRKYDLEKCF